MKSKKISILFICIALVVSCKVSFVPAFNASIVADITEGSKMTDALYLHIEQSPEKNFDLFGEEYIMIETQINSIILKDQARPKSGNILTIANNLKDAFIKYKTEHKGNDIINSAQAKIYNTYLQAFWKPLLVAETSLK